jgi:phosphopantothenoylcysteine synthetase/decarboxylase
VGAKVGSLVGKRILITSGPTRGPLDAVRYITNKSTGRLGAILAREALSRGARVTFVYGKGSLTPDAEELGPEELSRLKVIEIETVPQLADLMRDELGQGRYDAVLHSMAVLDYVPESYAEEKTRSGQDEWWIKLVRTPKVIKLIKELQPRTVLVGFKLEVDKSEEELIQIAHESLLANRADLVLANDLHQIEQGHHVGYIVNPAAEVEGVVDGKEEIARKLLDAVAERMAHDTS